MIVIFENGRLGNQISQYIGLQQYFSSELIVMIGYKGLNSLFSNLNAVVIPINPGGIVFHGLRKVMYAMAKIKIIDTYREDDNCTYQGTSRVRLVKDSFFQKNPYEIEEVKKLKFKAKLSNDELSLFDGNRNNVFVHMRRGDYLNSENIKMQAVKEVGWYKNMMNSFKDMVTNTHFIICTDDVHFVKSHFSNSDRCYISEGDELNDFLLMSRCNYGILSPSTFSLWAVYISCINNNEDADKYFISPAKWPWQGLLGSQLFPSEWEYIDYVD